MLGLFVAEGRDGLVDGVTLGTFRLYGRQCDGRRQRERERERTNNNAGIVDLTDYCNRAESGYVAHEAKRCLPAFTKFTLHIKAIRSPAGDGLCRWLASIRN